jgi:farnesyl diphosphate synthase
MSAPQDFQAWVKAVQADAESALDRFLPAESQVPAKLHEAMRYTALGGGKRVRPLLVHASGALFGAEADALARAAGAVEMIHVYSLVHDDMPCMDDDALRRGKPTVHVAYDEATALLVGDALQAQAFEVLAGTTTVPAARVVTMLRVSVLLGALAGRDLAPHEQEALAAYSRAIGLAFQVVDDVLDATADSATLGKTAGKDAAHDKPTYVSLLGLERSGAYAQELLGEALQALEASGLADTQALQALAIMVVKRDS